MRPSGIFLRRLAAAIVAVFACAGSVDLRYLQLLVVDRAPFREAFSTYSDRGAESYPRFLEKVKASTRPGDSIAIIVPMRHWDPGYRYAFFRATWFLDGRTVVPLVDSDDRAHLERIASSTWLAGWETRIEKTGYVLKWADHDGTLWRVH